MEDCLFCKIVNRDLPCLRVYEDDHFLGFLDIFPRAKGHTLIIPKKHYRWTYDVPEFGTYWEVAKKVSNATQQVLNAPWVSYFTFGAVQHAHIHILPRFENPDDITEKSAVVPERISLTKEELQEISKNIANYLA